MADTPRILVIEDVQADFQLLERYLRKQGLAGALHCIDRTEDLERALHEPWDLVLSDYQVAGMAFADTVKRLNAHDPDLPVILISGSIGEAGAIELLALGITDYILKDDLTRLAHSIQRALADRTQRLARHAAEARLQASEALAQARLREIERVYQHAPIGLCVLDRELRYLHINDRLAEINGIPAADHLGRTVRQVVPIMADVVELMLQQILATGEARHDIESVGETPAQPGVQRTWLGQYLPIFDKTGQVTGISIVVEEITRRKAAEDALRASEARLRLAQTIAEIGVWEWEVNSGRVIWSPELERLFNLPEGHFQGTFEAFVSHVHPDDWPETQRQIEDSLHEERPCEIIFRTHPDTRVQRWISTRGQMLRDAEGHPVRLIGASIDITHSKLAERQLLINHQLLLDQLPLHVWQKDLNLNWVTCNAALARLLGCSPDAIAGKSDHDLYPAELAEQFIASDRKTLETGEIQQFEIRFDGPSATAYQVIKAPLRDDMGAVIGILGIAEDITERKAMERANQEFQADLSATLQALPDMLFEIDENGHYIRLKTGKQDHLTAPLEDFVGHTVHEMLPAPVAEEVMAAIAQATVYGYDYGRTMRLILPDGVHFYDYSVARKATLPGETPRFIFLARDVTDRVYAIQQLRDSEARFSAFFNHARDGMIVVDVQSRRHVDANPALCSLFGYEREEFLQLEVLNVHPAEAQARVTSDFASLANNEKVIAERIPCLRKDGSVFHADITAAPVMLNDRPHVVGVFRDSTERMKHERALVQAREAAEAASIAKSRFLANMSHELRTPMNSILGMAQLLQQAHLPDQERIDYARTVLLVGQALLSLLNDLLDIAKIEAGKISLESLTLEPERLFDETRALFTGSAHARGLEFSVHWQGPSRQYRADTNRLRQILANLIANAIKFTEQGSITVRGRELESDANMAVLEISVEDTGIGLSPEDQVNLFKPFSQADDSISRKYGGTGLGLSIVRAIAQAMGGDSGVDSQLGQGSNFWIRVRVGIEHDIQNQQSRSDHATRQCPPLQGHILVVEDDPDNRKVIAAMLDQLNLTCTLASGGQECLDIILAGTPFDLILMDLRMPDLDGFVTTRRIRAWENDRSAARTPILCLTADVMDSNNADRIRDAGMDALLNKPVLLNELHCGLSKWLQAAASATPLKTVLRPLDVERMSDLLNELLPLLAMQKFSVFECFRRVTELARDTAAAAEIAKAGESLKQMQFDQVRDRLIALANEQGWEIAPP